MRYFGHASHLKTHYGQLAHLFSRTECFVPVDTNAN